MKYNKRNCVAFIALVVTVILVAGGSFYYLRVNNSELGNNQKGMQDNLKKNTDNSLSVYSFKGNYYFPEFSVEYPSSWEAEEWERVDQYEEFSPHNNESYVNSIKISSPDGLSLIGYIYKKVDGKKFTCDDMLDQVNATNATDPEKKDIKTECKMVEGLPFYFFSRSLDDNDGGIEIYRKVLDSMKILSKAKPFR